MRTSATKPKSGQLVDFLDGGKLRPGLVLREMGDKTVVLLPGGREKIIPSHLILVQYSDRRLDPAHLAESVAQLEQERARLTAELDLQLLWEVAHDQTRSYAAEELAELFFGERSPVAEAVMLEALLNDRLYFSRRHMEFVAHTPDHIGRVREQHLRMKLKGDASRRTHDLLRAALSGNDLGEDAPVLADQLTRFLSTSPAHNEELSRLLASTVTDVTPAEVAVEILDRLGVELAQPRFVTVGRLRAKFGNAALAEAEAACAPARARLDSTPGTVTIDDSETIEVDDALAATALAGGGLRVWIHIALAADLVAKGGALDHEAASRGTTVYLPEATVRMLPDAVGCDKASLRAGEWRNVLTTEVDLSEDGEVIRYALYPSTIRIGTRLDYETADRMLVDSQSKLAPEEPASMLAALNAMAARIRVRRSRAGALLLHRREPKVKVAGDRIEISVIDTASPSRLLVAEFMVLNNHLAARHAAEHRIPLIYRTQPAAADAVIAGKPRLSLFPDFHAGVGLPTYAQLSSPLRRYADLSLQRQLLASIEGETLPYEAEELMRVLAGAEATEAEAKDLERRARRFWTLRYLEREKSAEILEARLLRGGASAELTDYAQRGILRGAPSLASDSPILVRISRISPFRGLLTLEYVTSAVN